MLQDRRRHERPGGRAGRGLGDAQLPVQPVVGVAVDPDPHARCLLRSAMTPRADRQRRDRLHGTRSGNVTRGSARTTAKAPACARIRVARRPPATGRRSRPDRGRRPRTRGPDPTGPPPGRPRSGPAPPGRRRCRSRRSCPIRRRPGTEPAARRDAGDQAVAVSWASKNVPPPSSAQDSIVRLELLVIEGQPDDVDGGLEAAVASALHLGGRVALAGLLAVGDEHDDLGTRAGAQVTGHRARAWPRWASWCPC